MADAERQESDALLHGTDQMVAAMREHFPGAEFLPQMMASSLILQVARLITLRIEHALATLDLTTQRFEILGLLGRAEGGCLTIKELKFEMLLPPPTMTYTVDWMEKRDLVKRRPTSTDGRSSTVVITPKGRRLLEKAYTVVIEADFGMPGASKQAALAAVTAMSSLRP